MLYIVATPIGNLGELTYRATEVLNSVEYILCEDTRTSQVLLNKYDIKKKCVAYHKFNETEKVNKVIEDIRQGKDVALISDAGMPGISDPGNILVNALKDNDLKYTVVSGPCAFVNAFVLSGFSTPLTFVGFLPEKKSAKLKLLQELSNYNSTLIFYISPHNLADTFEFLTETLGDRECAVVREITKLYEEVTYSTLAKGYNGVEKGEFVLLVKGKGENENPLNEMTVKEHLVYYISQGISKPDAIKMVAKDRNLKKNEVYKIALEI